MPVCVSADVGTAHVVCRNHDRRRTRSQRRAAPRLLVFVSFAMPQPALTRLIDQAAAAGATLYLRGLVGGSLKETVTRVQPLLGGRRVPFEIDPRAFDRFAVAVTPAF